MEEHKLSHGFLWAKVSSHALVLGFRFQSLKISRRFQNFTLCSRAIEVARLVSHVSKLGSDGHVLEMDIFNQKRLCE